MSQYYVYAGAVVAVLALTALVASLVATAEKRDRARR